MAATSVFVSGATGYIAQHIVKQLISKGYHVVGTVRSVAKGELLKKNVGSENFSYEIVPDIQIEGAFDDALKKHPEVTVFLHTASPFHFKTDNPEKDLLIPAVNGTKNALAAIKTYAPQVKKVVITSSNAAVSPANGDDLPVINEDTWNDITWEEAKETPFHGYRGSKTFAEKAAWEFIREEKPNFVLSTVNPVLVFGPQAFDNEVKHELNTSAERVNSLIKLKPDDEVPSGLGSYVDVRDVAKAHLVAFENQDAEGQRLLLANGRFFNQEILDILNENIKSLDGKIPKGSPGVYPETKFWLNVNNDRTRKLLGFELTSLKKTVVDTAEQVLEVNVIKK